MKIETGGTPLVVDQAKDGYFAVDRRIYLDPELFELEMRHIFEGTWLYVCHESQIPNPGDYFTTHIGRQPVVIVRGQDRQVRGFVNACAHRGAVLCRTRKGTAKFFTCPYHGWVYDTAGKNVEVKDRATGGYPPAFEQQSHDLTALPRVASYRGFVFASLNPDVSSLEEHLGAAAGVVDLLALQSSDGMEVLPGSSTYYSRCNWKFQCENGVDGYHVTSVHANYMAMVMRRLQTGNDKVKAIVSGGDISKMPSGAYDLGGGHMLLWGLVPGGDTRPLNERRAEIEARLGPVAARWMINHSRNLFLFPNVFLMDQTSTQIRVIRPVSVDRTAIDIYGIAPVGESAKARNHRIRQYEDFFNASGMATPDDLTEFEACQNGTRGLADQYQVLERGLGRVQWGPDDAAREAGLNPAACGPNWSDETLFHGFYRRWHSLVAGR
jgi:benzoate/toluate 1,2-dioxygenase subunit alpha